MLTAPFDLHTDMHLVHDDVLHDCARVVGLHHALTYYEAVVKFRIEGKDVIVERISKH